MESYAKMYAEAKKENNLTELTAIYKKWVKKGDFIIGAFIGKTEVQSGISGNPYNQYLFDTDEGLTKFHLGKGGDSEIGQVMVKGGIYRIEFDGQEKIKGGRSVNTFKCVALGGEDHEVEEPETSK